MADRNVKVRLVAEVANFVAGMKQAKQATEEVAQTSKKSSEDASKSSRKAADDQKKSAADASTALLGLGAAAIAGVGFAVKAFADFDKQMSSVKAATHASSAEMGLLREAAITAGADSAFSAREAAQGIEELAKAGVKTADILKGGLKGSLDLAAAGELAVGDAAELAATAMTQFKLSGDKMEAVRVIVNPLLFELNNDLNASINNLRLPLEQGMFVPREFMFYF